MAIPVQGALRPPLAATPSPSADAPTAYTPLTPSLVHVLSPSLCLCGEGQKLLRARGSSQTRRQNELEGREEHIKSHWPLAFFKEEIEEVPGRGCITVQKKFQPARLPASCEPWQKQHRPELFRGLQLQSCRGPCPPWLLPSQGLRTAIACFSTIQRWQFPRCYVKTRRTRSSANSIRNRYFSSNGSGQPPGPSAADAQLDKAFDELRGRCLLL